MPRKRPTGRPTLRKATPEEMAKAQQIRALVAAQRFREEAEFQTKHNVENRIVRQKQLRKKELANLELKLAAQCREKTLYVLNGKVYILDKPFGPDIKNQILMSRPTARIINAHLDDGRWAVFMGLQSFEEWKKEHGDTNPYAVYP